MFSPQANQKAALHAVVASIFEDVLNGKADITLTEGSWVGSYRLTQKIGEGGFGIVWRAEQSEPYRRELALKVLKPGIDSEEVLARFQREQQLLARLNHPGIARVFDAGLTESDCPFIVMELILGVPITRYCREHKLGLESRLALFRQTLAALQHAHERGIIHRDLKPSNILVVEVDGLPQTKIIDFGIAKALSQDGYRKLTWMTRHRRLIGTPSYMSPEQTQVEAHTDTRTDIYALGVLLYELITGKPPFANAHSLEERIRHIREVEPPRPTGTRDSSELDWITLRCLEKQPDRRYPSAASLEEDLRRRQVGLPVSAHPPTRAYLMNRWLRRHRVLATAAFIAVSAFLLATGLAMRQRSLAETNLGVALDVQEALIQQLDQMIENSSGIRPQTAKFIRQVLEPIQSGKFPGSPALHRRLIEEASAAAEAAGDMETRDWAREILTSYPQEVQQP